MFFGVAPHFILFQRRQSEDSALPQHLDQQPLSRQFPSRRDIFPGAFLIRFIQREVGIDLPIFYLQPAPPGLRQKQALLDEGVEHAALDAILRDALRLPLLVQPKKVRPQIVLQLGEHQLLIAEIYHDDLPRVTGGGVAADRPAEQQRQEGAAPEL